MSHSHSLYTLVRRTSAALLTSLCIALAGAQAQAVWTVDPKTSLAWWQVSPHLNHLWATTCVAEPSWRPGEGRSSGWTIDKTMSTASRTGYQNVPDTVHVPLYPRRKVHAVCPADVVTGRLLLPDTVTWRHARGEVVVKADALTTGENMRDVFARERVLKTYRYPEIHFTLDSLVAVSRQADTLHATALGVLTLLGVDQHVSAAVAAVPEGDSTRVFAKIRIAAPTLISEWGISKQALGLGVVLDIWKDLFIGVDMVLVPARGGTK